MNTNDVQNTPLVSVIIPTYNRVNIVGCAIDSAFKQTYSHIEIIVVDDGSTDGTLEYVTRLGGSIKYISKKNGGVSSARNLGIKESSGELIAFLDSDDEWMPKKLEKQIQLLNNNSDFGMILCDYFFVDSSRKITEEANRRSSLPIDGYILNDVLKTPYLIPSSVLVKKKVLDDVGYFDEDIRTGEDLDLHLRIANKYKIALITEPLVKCMAGHEGLSILTRSYDDHVFVIERFINGHSYNIENQIKQNVLFKTYLGAANGKFWLNGWREGLDYTMKATKYITSYGDFFAVAKIALRGIRFYLKGLMVKICGAKIS